MRLVPILKTLKGHGALRVVGLVFGVACFAGAIWFAMQERQEFAAALGALRDPPPLAVAALLAAVAAGTLLTATLFHLLMRRYARIPFGEMLALITAAAFANYLPLKPGFIGRVAYHRLRHGIRAADSLRAILEAIALSGTVSSVFLGSLFLLRAAGLPGELALLAPSVLAGAGLLTPARTLALALLVRQAEFALLTCRYWIAFALIDASVDLEAAIVIASVNAIATLLPFISSGLGVREWLTGLITPLVSPDTFIQGLVAELVHRVAEIAVIAPLGILSAAALARHVRRNPAVPAAATPEA